jgi:hypothetical protein
MKTVTTNLDRGLGNQLFTFHAGLYLSLKTNSNLVCFDLTGIQDEKAKRKSAIDDLEITVSGAPFSIQWKEEFKSSFIVLIERVIHKMCKKWEVTRKLMRQYRSITYGFDSRLDSLKAPIQIWGNYQSWRYPKALADRGIRIEYSLKHFTDWYLELSERAMYIRPIAIHMRRGDYNNYAHDLGLLADEYYIDALRLFLNSIQQDKKEIWIFSDSLDEAHLLKEKIEQTLEINELLGGIEIKVIHPPLTSTSAENLLLLSKSSIIIGSNSSWSWWASWIAGNNCHVVTPEPYYKAFYGEFIDHIPDHWQRFPSKFL